MENQMRVREGVQEYEKGGQIKMTPTTTNTRNATITEENLATTTEELAIEQEMQTPEEPQQNEGANVPKTMEQENDDNQSITATQHQQHQQNLRRSTRQRNMTRHMMESIEQEELFMPITLQSIKYDDDYETFLD
jgi:hypothetical protein